MLSRHHNQTAINDLSIFTAIIPIINSHCGPSIAQYKIRRLLLTDAVRPAGAQFPDPRAIAVRCYRHCCAAYLPGESVVNAAGMRLAVVYRSGIQPGVREDILGGT
jgi:hypothetical protein